MKRIKQLALGTTVVMVMVGAASWTALGQDHAVIENDPWCQQVLERNDADKDRFYACEVREMSFEVEGDLVRISTSPNGGLSVKPGDGDDIHITVKIAANAPTTDEAQALVDEITIESVDGLIRSLGREKQDGDEWSWWVNFEVTMPAYLALEASGVNGGIDIDGIEGDIEAQTVNGGIDIFGCAGAILAGSVNGGIDVSFAENARLAGSIDLSTTNGGIDLTLPDGAGAELDLSTHMGGIDVSGPFQASSRSSKVVQGTLGDGGPAITISTHMGGIDVTAGHD